MEKIPKVSIIIPLYVISERFFKDLEKYRGLNYSNFEIIIVYDRKVKFPPWPNLRLILIHKRRAGPAEQRDLAIKYAKGEICAFIDDDAYPDPDWLKNAVRHFKNKEIAAVCGPTLTPPHNNLRQKTSGYVWSTWLGSGGAGIYRCTVSPRREVDDYPTANFLVKKKDFLAIDGFDSHFWPGEDTKLCHDLVYKLNKKIIYVPKALVYHHRREVFGPHLEQISRYAIHRGHFARILPKTSLRLGYLIPTLFVLGLVVGFFLSFVHPVFQFIYLSTIGIYLIALLVTATQVYFKEKNLKLALLVIPSIVATHLLYGILFIKGYLSPELKR